MGSYQAAKKKRQERDASRTSRRSLLFHLKTVWLFTRSDIKSMIYPNIFFGCIGALSGMMSSPEQQQSVGRLASRLPSIITWLWINLLLFNISNQRLPGSALEDAINKPWRPIPAQRITAIQSRWLLLGLVPLVLVYSYVVGVLWYSLVLIALTWMYNDLGGADEHYLVRNLLNAYGMALYSSGALQLAQSVQPNAVAIQWTGIVSAIVFSTIQLQDLEDQHGDRLKGRKTFPLAIGDWPTRKMTAFAIMAWSVAAPSFWSPNVFGYILPLTFGSSLTFRVIKWRNLGADRGSWKLWSIWMISIYLVPLFASAAQR